MDIRLVFQRLVNNSLYCQDENIYSAMILIDVMVHPQNQSMKSTRKCTKYKRTFFLLNPLWQIVRE